MSAVERADFISIVVDSSTDRAVTESKVVYINIIEDGTVKSHFVDSPELSCANAIRILSAIDATMKQSLNLDPDHWRKKLVGFGSD